MSAPRPPSSSLARLGDSRRRMVEHLKRRGPASIPQLADAVGLSPETVRSHVRILEADGLVVRTGSRRRGPGRPERIYELGEGAEALFPRREGEVLRGLAAHLGDSGHQEMLASYFEGYVAERKERGLRRLAGLEGRKRLEELARILTEDGFMAEVVDGEDGAEPRLRLSHCPLRELVRASRIPCRAEIGLVRELLGAELARVEYLPAGDAACAYAVRLAGGEGG